MAKDDWAATRLAQNGLEPSRESLDSFLRQYLSPDEDREHFQLLLNQLGNQSFQVREQAMSELIRTQEIHLNLLENARQSDDPEIRYRADQLAKAFRDKPSPQRRDQILEAVLHTIVNHEIHGLLKPLVEIVEQSAGTRLGQQAQEAAIATLEETDVEELRLLLQHPSASVRAVSVRGIAQLLGEASAEEIAVSIEDADEAVRFAVANCLADFGDRRSLQAFVDLLNSADEAIRRRSNFALCSLLDVDHGFDADAEPESREVTVAKWEAWLVEHGSEAELTFPLPLLKVDPRGLVLHLSFDEFDDHVPDQSGSDNDAVNFRALHVEEGRINGGCKISGAGEYLSIPNSESLEIRESLTIAVWVKLNSFLPGGYGNEEGHILKKGDPLWWNPAYGIGFRKGGRRAKFVVGDPRTPRARAGADLYSEEILETDTWYQLVGTYDGLTAKLYINGRLDKEKEYEGGIRGDRAPVMIGGGQLGSTSAFANHFGIDGVIDEIQIYRRALSSDEVSMLYNLE